MLCAAAAAAAGVRVMCLRCAAARIYYVCMYVLSEQERRDLGGRKHGYIAIPPHFPFLPSDLRFCVSAAAAVRSSAVWGGQVLVTDACGEGGRG